MKQALLDIVQNSNNLLYVQRAKRLLRIRYNMVLPKRNQCDPVWLSVYNI